MRVPKRLKNQNHDKYRGNQFLTFIRSLLNRDQLMLKNGSMLMQVSNVVNPLTHVAAWSTS